MINMRSQLERIVCGSSGSRRTTCGADRDSKRVREREGEVGPAAYRVVLMRVSSH